MSLMTDRNTMKLWIVIFLLGAYVILFTSIILFYTDIWYKFKGAYFYDTDSFIKTDGKIKNSEICVREYRRSRYFILALIPKTYYPGITYSFEVDHKEYSSDKIAFARINF